MAPGQQHFSLSFEIGRLRWDRLHKIRIATEIILRMVRSVRIAAAVVVLSAVKAAAQNTEGYITVASASSFD